jgi:hypothetical protein
MFSLPKRESAFARSDRKMGHCGNLLVIDD